MSEIQTKVSELACNLLNWVQCNGLALNLKKTYYMVFTNRRINTDIELRIDNIVIKRVTETRFLGVLIDEKLTWKSHISAMKAKMSRYVGIMYKLKGILPLKVRLQIYHSFVQSHLNYCSLVWGFSAKANIEKLFSSQKKGVRAAMPGFTPSFYKNGVLPTHTKQFFNKNKILTIHNIIIKNAIIFMDKVRFCPWLLPPSVCELIAENAPVLGATYESCSEWLVRYGSPGYRGSLFFKGPLVASDARYCENLTRADTASPSAYKNSIKRILLQLQSQGEPDEWEACNFPLYSITGLRRSARLQDR